MSVVVKDKQESYLFVKGAFESIRRLCVTQIGDEVVDYVNRKSFDGCYILAFAMRRLRPGEEEATRDMVEKDLLFLGLAVFRNDVKQDARLSILKLKKGHIKPVMVTGDSFECAFYVAKESCFIEDFDFVFYTEKKDGVEWKDINNGGQLSTLALLDLIRQNNDSRFELIVTGDCLDELLLNGLIYNEALLLNVRIFARMSPSQKVAVVKLFMHCKFITAMCGDGGNDSGALKSSHVGLSMSASESSIVAPFNTNTGRVMDAVELIKEGRASLSTSLASYKLLVVYGILFSIEKLASFYFGGTFFIFFFLFALMDDAH